jgi:ubiquinone/menaquinone biosynthesis C-methylase UbiE
MKILHTGFDVERWRKQLLAKKEFGELQKTYSSRFPEIADENSGDFWDNRFSAEEDLVFPMATDRNRIVAESISQNEKVLNIGVGNGYLEGLVFERCNTNISWTGTDITKKTLDTLQKKYPKYSFVKSKITQLPFKDQSFDTVCLLEVLEHISPSQTLLVLKEINRVLKSSGRIIISVPLNEGLEEMMPYNPNSHLRVYSVDLLEFELQSCGFSVQSKKLLSAFATFYTLKNFINSFIKLREPNNVVIWATKSVK